MYWYEKTDEEHVGYKYYYFEYPNPSAGLLVNHKTVLTHQEFIEWYEKNKNI